MGSPLTMDEVAEALSASGMVAVDIPVIYDYGWALAIGNDWRRREIWSGQFRTWSSRTLVLLTIGDVGGAGQRGPTVRRKGSRDGNGSPRKACF
jgi:hypothetical protein